MSSVENIQHQQRLEREGYLLFKINLVFVALVHPSFHFFLGLLPNPPPDSLFIRIIGVLPDILSGIILFIFPSLRKYSQTFISIALIALLVSTHLLVINSGNHYLYFSSALVAVFGVQFVFLQPRELLFTYGTSFSAFLYLIWSAGTSLEAARFSVTYFFSAYAIALAMAIARIQSRKREFLLQMKVLEQNKAIQIERMKSFQQAKLASLGVMAGGIAHEINNPLATIALNADFLTRMQKSGGQPDLKTIGKSIDAIQHMVKRISEIVRYLRVMADNSFEAVREVISIRKLIDGVLSLHGAKLSEAGIEIDLSGFHDLLIKGRETDLSQAFSNLILNAEDALTFSFEKKIWISTQSERHQVVFRMANSGEGIPPINRSRIFEPFFSTKEVGKHMGLGLSIARSLIEANGGTIELDEQSSKICFLIRLPLADT